MRDHPSVVQLTSVTSHERFSCRHPVLSARPGAGTAGFTLHARAIPFQKIDVISQHDELIGIETMCRGRAQSRLALLDTAEVNVERTRPVISNPRIRIDL